ncbi:hypothetical protein [Methylobacterium oxalidis]|uniref:Uncharacterized protein n=1 Tax=Methylobacterium oxalidis TaxID=944322 RepID=A0A512J511_9HYPH|nr:hypothetical protein [Methylobacterium oxalidis]GEP05010.1 hypothetical protein MOX02_30480 [Methylobacterium oxalidis]GJE34794.1 hypothetical protein LDDCCGHA_5009 [Methylobacterium oxalidis]GLS63748.1 hypothetical protein GCM10007888_21290 [Methylobacterium oxalidis]
MSISLALPITEAAFFTAGCAVIHAQRARAEQVTAALACLVVLLTFALGVASLPGNLLQEQPPVAFDPDSPAD